MRKMMILMALVSFIVGMGCNSKRPYTENKVDTCATEQTAVEVVNVVNKDSCAQTKIKVMSDTCLNSPAKAKRTKKAKRIKKDARNITSEPTPDPGQNINLAPMYNYSGKDHPAGNDSIRNSFVLFPARNDTTSPDLIDKYAHDFYEWEERVGMEQMLFWKRYPSWYGGFYIDNGKMYFLLTSEEGVNTLPEGAIWKKCKYSHNELEAISQKVSDGIDDHLDLFKSVGISIDDRINRVVVMLRNNSPEAIKFFKENIYSGDEVFIY